MQTHLELSITSYCQAKCPSCLRTELLLEKSQDFSVQHVDLARIKTAIKNMAGTVQELTLCGEFGDPLMHPDVEEIISFVTQHNIRTAINTNGGLRAADFFKRLAKNENVSFHFGIDGMDSETSQKYRVDVDWERAWHNMNTWFSECHSLDRDVKYTGGWNLLVFDFNKHQILDIYHYAKENRIPLFIRINRRTSYGYVGDAEYARLRKMINELK
jgi:MoaA/NifB/PqqE/SkfB family radical SAM enzyme